MEIGKLAGDSIKDLESLGPSCGESSVLWSLQAELARCSSAGDWDTDYAIAAALYGLSNWKGKGGQGGKGI
jgi:hypothetical protein